MSAVQNIAGKLAAWHELAAARCILNGQEVECARLGSDLAWFGGVAIIVFFLFWLVLAAIGIGTFVFWILMLVHAASKPIDNRPMWIVLIALTGVVGALVYYFVVKRKMPVPILSGRNNKAV